MNQMYQRLLKHKQNQGKNNLHIYLNTQISKYQIAVLFHYHCITEFVYESQATTSL